MEGTEKLAIDGLCSNFTGIGRAPARGAPFGRAVSPADRDAPKPY
jgi:hypothetical protein